VRARTGTYVIDYLEKSIPSPWRKIPLPGVGHCTLQEVPTEVNRLMVDFLLNVDGKDAAR
jgi:hypothetical protein